MKNQELNNLSLDVLKEKIKTNSNMLKNLMAYCSNLRSTNAFWSQRGYELIFMVN